MNIVDTLKLLKAGFTAEEIRNMSKEPEEPAEPPKEPEEPPKEPEEPAEPPKEPEEPAEPDYKSLYEDMKKKNDDLQKAITRKPSGTPEEPTDEDIMIRFAKSFI